MPTLADRVKILVDWWPLVVLLQQVAVCAPGRPQAEAFADCLRFLASKTEVDVDDRLVEHVQKLIATPEEYAGSLRPVCEFSTVEEFWKFWTFIPRPRY